MGELVQASERKLGVYGRVHAAQYRLPALVFVSPDFSGEDYHPEHYFQYFSQATIVKLPADAEQARRLIIETIKNAAQHNVKTHNVVFLGHGSPDQIQLAGAHQKAQSVEELLMDLVKVNEDLGGKKVIANNIIFTACDILANATEAYLNRLAALPSKLKANVVAAANVAHATVIYGKPISSTPAVGDFYQISQQGHFIPFFDFRNDDDLMKKGWDLSASLGHDPTLVTARAALDKNDCATDAVSQKCDVIRSDYNRFMKYRYAVDYLNSQPQGLSIVAANAPPKPAVDAETLARVKTIGSSGDPVGKF